MFNKSVQSNRNLLSGQLHRIIMNKQSQREEIDYVRRKNSLKYPVKEQIDFQKSSNYFNARNSMNSLEQVFRVETNKKFKSPIVVLHSINNILMIQIFVSNKNRKCHQSSSQEPGPSIPGIKKPHECGYRIVVNRASRVPTIQMDEEMGKEESKLYFPRDPVSFTDWVERIYGKEWFY